MKRFLLFGLIATLVSASHIQSQPLFSINLNGQLDKQTLSNITNVLTGAAVLSAGALCITGGYYLYATCCKSMVKNRLAVLLNEENFSLSNKIVNMAAQYNIFAIRAHFPTSAWPLVKAWKELEERRLSYRFWLDWAAERDDYNTYEMQNLVKKAEAIIIRYQNAQYAIAGLPEYSEEKRAKRIVDIQHEQLMESRLQTNAQMRSARAQEQLSFRI